MALVTGVREAKAGRSYQLQWTPLLNGDDGSGMMIPGASDKSVQVTGATGTGGSVQLEGSNLDSPAVDADWFILKDGQGNDLVFTAVSVGEMVAENTLWVRPHVTAGDGATSFTVTVLARSTMR